MLQSLAEKDLSELDILVVYVLGESVTGEFDEDASDRVRSGISGACGEVGPVLVPVVAVHDGAEAGHAVDSADFPAGAGLFQAASNQVFAGTFDQAPSIRPLPIERPSASRRA